LPAKSLKNKSTQGFALLSKPPSWLWLAAAIFLWVLTLLAAGILAGFSQQDPTFSDPNRQPVHHPLGYLAALLAGLAYESWGLACWWVIIILPLAGLSVWRGRGFNPLLPLSAGAFWLCLGTAAMLGLTDSRLPLGGGSAALPMGGLGGVAMAQGLLHWLAPFWAWFVPGVVAAGGLAAMVWAAWPVLGPFLEPYTNAKPENQASPEPAPPLPPREEPISLQPDMNKTPDPGPRIRPRAAQPTPVKPTPKAAPSPDPVRLPSLDLLQAIPEMRTEEQEEVLRQNSRLLEAKLADFGVQGQVVEVAPGPVVTMYEFKPAPGVKISKVANLSHDLAMNLKASSIRIVAPIPGKAVIGIEIPSQQRETVFLRELMSSSAFQNQRSPLTIALGKDILGAPVVEDLSRMPHLLIAGATGSGKSVFINTLVLSILYKASPSMVRLIMVDPKRIELSTYNDIPHLLHPIITNPREATAGLRWAVNEMERRYELLAHMGVRGIESFNRRLLKRGWPSSSLELDEVLPPPDGPLPYIVIVIDELADLMMVSSKEVESLITRLAQMARAAGMHLVLATQRPSVDVITGLIKANFPARISFQVTSRVDSRTILDQQGAENLLGNGDMLFMPPGTASIVRLHGAYVSDAEIQGVADYLKAQARPEYDESIVQTTPDGEAGNGFEEEDEKYLEAVALVRQTGQASISFVQRRLRVGYNRAARMIEQMEREGIVGPSDGSRPREVLSRD
jgi:S-DNA-T family DNA segregation ATPase FtsK/SpoIIIE